MSFKHRSFTGLTHPRAKNLIGQTFGDLTVIAYAGVRNGRNHWICQCNCSNMKTVSQNNLQTGGVQYCSRKCGHAKKKRVGKGNGNSFGLNHHKVKNLTGLKFGTLTAVKLVRSVNGRSQWLCGCDCGGEKICDAVNLVKGAIKYCSKNKCPLKPRSNQYIAKKLSIENDLHETANV